MGLTREFHWRVSLVGLSRGSHSMSHSLDVSCSQLMLHSISHLGAFFEPCEIPTHTLSKRLSRKLASLHIFLVWNLKLVMDAFDSTRCYYSSIYRCMSLRVASYHQPLSCFTLSLLLLQCVFNEVRSTNTVHEHKEWNSTLNLHESADSAALSQRMVSKRIDSKRIDSKRMAFLW